MQELTEYQRLIRRIAATDDGAALVKRWEQELINSSNRAAGNDGFQQALNSSYLSGRDDHMREILRIVKLEVE